MANRRAQEWIWTGILLNITPWNFQKLYVSFVSRSGSLNISHSETCTSINFFSLGILTSSLHLTSDKSNGSLICKTSSCEKLSPFASQERSIFSSLWKQRTILSILNLGNFLSIASRWWSTQTSTRVSLTRFGGNASELLLLCDQPNTTSQYLDRTTSLFAHFSPVKLELQNLQHRWHRAQCW